MDVEIRQVRAEDAALLERVADDVFDAAIDPARLAAYLADPGHLMLVALQAGEVVGQLRAMVHLHPDRAPELYLDNLGVTPRLQRRGIARRMLAAMLEIGRSLGCEEAWVGTETDNEAARGLYRGFKPREEEPFSLYLYRL